MRTNSKIRQTIPGFILMTALLCGTVACKKDKDDVPGPTPAPPPAAQKIKEFQTGDEFIRFDYNPAGDVSKVTINSEINTGGAEMVYTVHYAAGKKIASLESAGGRIVPVYENNILKRADLFEAEERIGYTNYHFENGLLKKATIYGATDDDFAPLLEFDFSYNTAGNITETVAMVANGEPGQMVRSGHVTCQYDQKTNPLYTQRELLALFWQGASKNNIRLEDHFDSDLQPEDKYVYDYQYHSNGLPKSAVVTQGLPGEPTTTNQLKFIYQ